VIISASRRTDIPAFYSEWLVRRFEEGFCDVVNPFNPNQVSRVSLRSEDVDALVLWTRFPEPLLPSIPWLLDRGVPVAALVTVVDYPRPLEPRTPPSARRIDAFRNLASLCPAGAVRWRYDPVILSTLTPERYHVERFARIAGALRGYTDRVIVSLLDEYRSVRTALERVSGFERIDDEDAQRALVARLAEIADRNGMRIQSCSDPRLAGVPGVVRGGCISGELVKAAGFTGKLPGADRSQRRDCACIASRDIGSYETCRFGCAYCYATHGTARVQKNAARHDPKAPMLIPTEEGQQHGQDDRE
jgi:hypothetical protein